MNRPSSATPSAVIQGRRPRLSPAEIAAVAQAHFGDAVQQISAPGGAERDSVRVSFAGRSIIATQRADDRGFDTECLVLSRLSDAGAPVPRFLGTRDGVLFQEDAGRARLSVNLETGSDSRRRDLASAAFRSLRQLKSIAHQTGLAADLPALAMNHDWLTEFANAPAALSRDLGLFLPELDVIALAQALVQPTNTFVKWDARPGNAAIDADGRIIWFDWEHAGCRAGPEDFGFLAGDEFWPLGPDATLEIFARSSDQVSAEDLRFLTCFTTLQIVQRMGLILDRLRRKGWTDTATALRYDRTGATPEVLSRLARHGAGWAAKDRRVAPLADWFAPAAAAIAAIAQP